MNEHILIVEDEEKLARFVELELLHEGYQVSKSSNGREALAMAVAGDFDLILLDIMLPGLNGLEVLRLSLIHISRRYRIACFTSISISGKNQVAGRL